MRYLNGKERESHLTVVGHNVPIFSHNLYPVVQRPISASPGLNVNAGLYISFFQNLLEKFSLFFFRTSNDQIASKKI